MKDNADLEYFVDFLTECNVGCYLGGPGATLFDPEDQDIEFYPLGTVTVSTTKLIEINEEQFNVNINQLIDEALNYGRMKLTNSEKEMFESQIFRGLEAPKYYTNFSGNAWAPTTTYSRDSFLLITDKTKSLAIISFDDE